MSRPARHPVAGDRGATPIPAVSMPAQAGRAAAGTAVEAPPAADTDRRARRERGRGYAVGWPARLRLLGRRIGQAAAGPATLDLAVCAIYAAFALWLTKGLWPDPTTRAIADNVPDQALIEWFLAHGVLFWTGDFDLVTDRLNSPDGVNLMSNASHILHGVVMAPVTATFGAPVSFALLVGLNLAATAAGWYLLLARTLRLHRGAAFAAGVLAGFAPGMIAQSHSHLHMTAQWLVPPIVWCVINLARSATPRRTVVVAVTLAGLVCAQVFLGEEVLFLAALTLTIFSLVFAARERVWARRVASRFLGGMALATAVAGLALIYPLWIQFAGPQHIPNAPFEPYFYYADVASFALFSPLSVAGSPEAGRLASSSAEYNTFLGLPLIVVVLGCVVWRRRSPVTVAAATTSLVMILLSLGPKITIDGRRIGWPGIYALVDDVPVINGALPTRYALALIPLIGLLLAYALDAAIRGAGIARLAVPVAVVAALLPILPKPLVATDRDPVPEFVSTGAWRSCAPEGGVIVPVPLPTPRQPDLMRWPAAANSAFSIPEGFFIGPYGAGGRSSLGTYPRPTSALFAEVARTGTVPAVDDVMRRQAHADLAFWRADCVALAPVPYQSALRETVERLLGPATAVADTWTWRVVR